MDNEIKKVLEKINFAQRFLSLSTRFLYPNESFEKYSNEDILKLLVAFGYKVKYNKNENFFKVLEEIGAFQFQLNISCNYGIVELITDVLKNNNRLPIGGPWTRTYKLLLNTEHKVRYPAFRNYEDFKNIMSEVFEIFEDLKRELLQI